DVLGDGGRHEEAARLVGVVREVGPAPAERDAQRRAGDDHSVTDSHFAVAAARRGCDTIRCHTSACRPSVWGVTWAASTVGMSTLAVALVRGLPPSRPATPTMLAPTSLASTIACTRFGLMLRSSSPPPTENTNRQSR